MTRILFVGETWQGSSARSWREALALLPGVVVQEVGEDHFIPRYRHLPLRIGNRLLRFLQVRELESAIRQALDGFNPDVVVVAKGSGIRSNLVDEIRRSGHLAVNFFPDLSPLVHGPRLKKAIGCYDLVISTKPFHPQLWRTVYGYSNPCVCVPHGYDPEVHLWTTPSFTHIFDVALCATWRPEYHKLMRSFADALGNSAISVAIAGSGWTTHRSELPGHWQSFETQSGLAYGEFLRTARIAIAPVTTGVEIKGVKQPGDEDTTRTYELAAAHCFFLHQRTDYIASVYDEHSEVPFWSNAQELASLVQRWLPDEAGRQAMAARAHARAVPAYSIHQRAASMLEHIDALISTRAASRAST